METTTPFEHYREMMDRWSVGDWDEADRSASSMLLCLVERNDELDDSNWYVSALTVLAALGRCDRSVVEEAIEHELSDAHQAGARDALLLQQPHDPLCWMS